MKYISAKKGSAMIIAIIVTTFISVATVATSQLIMSESRISLRYLDGITAGYGADAGVEWGLSAAKKDANLGNDNTQSSSPIKDGKLEIYPQKTGDLRSATFTASVWRALSEGADLVVAPGATQDIGLKGVGNMSWRLVEINKRSGPDSCPSPNTLFVYLSLSDSSGKSAILNRFSNATGTWPSGGADQSYYLTSNNLTLHISPIVLTSFLPSSANLESTNLAYPPAGCDYETKWQVSLPGGSIKTPSREIRGVGIYNKIQETAIALAQ